MLFSSIPFLYYFLPVVLAAYFLVPARLRNGILLCSSLIFYGWGEPKYVFLMMISILSGYGFGLLLEHYRGKPAAKLYCGCSVAVSLGFLLYFKYVFLMMISILSGYGFGLLLEHYRGKPAAKLYCGCSVAVSLGFLLYFKYTDFFLENFNALTGLDLPLLRIALPVGISFYTFQIISYTVDVYRGEPAQRNLIHLAAYISMFPQLIAGPIVRYSDIADQLKNRKHSTDLAAYGIRRFILGLGKKILIANQLGELCSAFRSCQENSIRKHSTDLAAYGIRRFILGLGKKILIANQLGELCSAFRSCQENSIVFHWLYGIAFCLHIYFDFSGYSDMAIGLGKIFGFHFMENFNYPYISASITEFWRRWHISLGTWFRDYVYIPMGGNRVGKGRWFFNILVVWMLTGFWHGAAWNFVLWGLLFALLLILEKLWLLKSLQKHPVFAHIYVLFFVMLSFILFDAQTLWGLLFALLLILEKLWLLKSLQKHPVFAHIYVLFFVMLSFILFDAQTLAQAVSHIGGLFGMGKLPFSSPETVYYLRSFAPLLVLALLGATPLPKKLFLKLSEHPIAGKVFHWTEVFALLLLLLVMTAFLVDGSFNPFLYFRF